MNPAVILLLVQIAACWPVWMWYAKRMTAGNADDQWCLLAAVTAIAFLLMERKTVRRTDAIVARAWLLPTGLLLLYAATFHWLPPMLRAIIAVVAIGITASLSLLRKPLSLSTAGLLLLALPTIPLSQFYLGYPLRIVVGAVTAPLLQLSGLHVVRVGTGLDWNGQLISIDAPCSGIRMLWAGMFLLFTAAWFYRLTAGKTLLAALISLGIIVAGNILRACALFYLEAEIVQLPISANLAHDGVGIVTFLFTAIGLVVSVLWLQRFQFTQSIQLCDPPQFSSSPVS
jgi:exosortase/archaeosortase family protein